MHWRRKWQLTPVFLSGESQGWGELGGLPSMGPHRVGHDWSDLAVSVASSPIVSMHNFYCLPILYFQFSSVAQLCLTLCNPMNRSMPGLPVHHQLPSPPKSMSIKSVIPSNHLIICCPLLLLPSVFPSIRVFFSESALHIKWLKVLEFQLQHLSFRWNLGLISFRIDWFDLPRAQGTHKSPFQRHHVKAKSRVLSYN